MKTTWMFCEKKTFWPWSLWLSLTCLGQAPLGFEFFDYKIIMNWVWGASLAMGFNNQAKWETIYAKFYKFMLHIKICIKS